MNPSTLSDELSSARSVLVLAPHQDDEILGCGYLMRAFSQTQTELAVVWLTDGGSAFGPISEPARAALAARRAAEAKAGLRSMDIVCETLFFGYPDGDLAQYVEVAVEKLRALCGARAVEAIFVTDAGDGHPDHRAAFEIASQIPGPALYSYPVSARYDGDDVVPPRNPITLTAADGAAKRKALACHVSQHEGGEAVYPLTSAAIDRFCAAPEMFYPIRARQT